MRVNLSDGCCRTCGREVEIVDADDATMTVQCVDPVCADCYAVEPDALGDGGLVYYVDLLTERLEARDSS